ncbi:hypothetical protein RYX36_035632 [Vicia faba]
MEFVIFWLGVCYDLNRSRPLDLELVRAFERLGLVVRSSEVEDLEKADITVIQIDEAALREVGKFGSTTKGSEGEELVDGLVIREEDFKLVKTRFSAFFSTHLHSVLQREGINSLVITGVQTPNCICQTVFNDVALDYQHVTVLFDATVAATPDIHLANVFDMKNIGVATPTLQECSESKA